MSLVTTKRVETLQFVRNRDCHSSQPPILGGEAILQLSGESGSCGRHVKLLNRPLYFGKLAGEINLYAHPESISTHLRFLSVKFPSDLLNLRFHSLSERC